MQSACYFLILFLIYCLYKKLILIPIIMCYEKQSTQQVHLTCSFVKRAIVFCLIIFKISSATTWLTFPYIRAGKILMVSSLSDYGTIFSSTTIPYSSSIGNSSSVLHLTLSLCNFAIYEVNQISFDVNITSIGQSSSIVKIILKQSFVVSLMTFQYLIVDTQSQEIDYKSINYNCVNLANLNGFYRSENISIPVSNFVYSDADKLQYNLYLQSISMSNFNGSFFHFQPTLNYNRSHYVITIKTSDYNIITRVKISMILFRTNHANFRWSYIGFYYHFKCLDVNCFLNFIPVSTYPNPNYQNQNRVYYGIKSFNFTKQGQKTYNIDLNQYTNLSINFQFSNTIEFLQIDAFYMAYRGCSAGTYYCPATYVCDVDCTNSSCQNAYTPYLVCLGCHFSCLTCTTYSPGSCLSCDSNMNRIISGANCLCKNGFVEIGTEKCAPCVNYILGCTNCTDRSTCQSCNSGMTLNTANNPDTCLCSNPSSFLTLNGSCISINGCLSFLNQSNIIKCTECNNSALYYEVNFTCICQPGTSQVTYSDGVTKYCKIICGNGYVSIEEQCDDGNIINGDGCSSTCIIQVNFACYGELYNKSRCFEDITLNITYIGTLRNSISNRATMYFNIIPYRSALLNIKNGSSLLNTTLFQYCSYFEVSFSKSSISGLGQLTVSFDYFEDIQGKFYNLYLNLNQSGYFVYPTNTSYFTISEINSKLVYNSNIDNFLSFASIAFYILIGFGFLIFFISLFHQKMIGVQLMNTIQMYFFYLMLVDSISIQLMPIQETLLYANGYNSLNTPDYFSTYPLPNQLIRSGFQKQFITNFNLMFLLLLFSFVQQLFQLIKMKFCQNNFKISKKKKKLQSYQSKFETTQQVIILSKKFIWGRWFLCTGLIFTNQIIMSFIVESLSIDQVIWDYQRVLSSFAAFLGLLLVLITFLLLFYYILDGDRSFNSNKFTTNILSFQNILSCYPFLFMTFQIIKILLVGMFYFNQNTVYILFSLQTVYFIIYLIFRPYRQKHQYQAIRQFPHIKKGQKIDMLNFDDFKSKTYCFSIHNVHNLFNSFGLIIYLVLIFFLNKFSKNSQDQETIGKIMVYLCFFHILISQILALLRLIPIKLAILSDYLKNCCINCMKNDKNALQQNNIEEEQRILKQQRQKIINNNKLSKNNIKNQVERSKKTQKQIVDDNSKKNRKNINFKQEQKQFEVGKQKKLDRNIKTIQQTKSSLDKNKQKKQKGWLLKQVQDSETFQINSKRKKQNIYDRQENDEKSKVNRQKQKSPKKKKKCKLVKSERKSKNIVKKHL